MTRLVEEGLVVVKAPLRAGDQVDDRRRIGRDHARPRRLLRPVVEIEPDAWCLVELEAGALQGVEAALDRALLRLRRLERWTPPQEGYMAGRRSLVANAP